MSEFGPNHHGCTCWACFDQNGTNSILDSHNCSGHTDDGTGLIDINFSNNMGNNNYASGGNSEITGHFTAVCVNTNNGGSTTASVAKATTRTDNGVAADPNKGGALVFGDLA
tara:strand:- start:664 stop:999 length:336 start_codon:yes stop_codon:yes gene_type:complete